MHFSSTENVIWLEIVALAPTGANIYDSGKPKWNWKMRTQRCQSDVWETVDIHLWHIISVCSQSSTEERHPGH